MNWIQHPVIIEGKRIRLEPLDSKHIPALLEIAHDKRIWEFMSIDYSDTKKLETDLKSVLLQRATGEQYPFAIIDKETNAVIGSTRFHSIYHQHKKLEIGWTWNDPAYWGKGYNTEAKYLLLTYCFETLRTVRVQFVTSEKNLRSRKAIEKIGAKFEGIMRKERQISDGSHRNTTMFSIIDEEWDEVKRQLERKLSYA